MKNKKQKHRSTPRILAKFSWASTRFNFFFLQLPSRNMCMQWKPPKIFFFQYLDFETFEFKPEFSKWAKNMGAISSFKNSLPCLLMRRNGCHDKHLTHPACEDTHPTHPPFHACSRLSPSQSPTATSLLFCTYICYNFQMIAIANGWIQKMEHQKSHQWKRVPTRRKQKWLS